MPCGLHSVVNSPQGVVFIALQFLPIKVSRLRGIFNPNPFMTFRTGLCFNYMVCYKHCHKAFVTAIRTWNLLKWHRNAPLFFIISLLTAIFTGFPGNNSRTCTP